MKGDFTRFTFRRADQFSGVRLQQGRVQVDADWNEQVDLQLDRERTEIRDVVGPAGAPAADPGFGIVPVLGAGVWDFAITPGRMYVRGILASLEAERVTASQVTAGSLHLAGRWLDGRTLETGQWLEIRGTGPNPVHRARVTGVAAAGQAWKVDFAPALADTAYFASPTVRRQATYLTQPDLPGAPLAQENTRYLAYLDVWERHVTALENGRLREVALGGPDTATRTQVVWQVRLEALQNAQVCADLPPDWLPGGQSSGRLRARGQPAQDTATPCIVPQGAGYRRLENQLYRVEIHGTGNTPRYKWSRDNGHVVSRVRSVFTVTSQIEVEPQGRDDVLDFAPGQVVEISEPGAALRGEPGLLAAVSMEADGALTLGALPGDPALSLAGVAAGWVVRRWDGTATVQPGQWVDLEEGVQVFFEPGGAYRPGDWWAIPARTATADVEWPRQGTDPVGVPAHGVRHAYAPLAILSYTQAGGWKASDCRRVFPPLTGLVRMVYLGGDGQEAMPTTPNLPQPLRVGVLNGGIPMEGVEVRFTVEAGGGVLNGGGNTATVQTVGGVATAQWRLGTTDHAQRVRAELLMYGADAVHPRILFSATLSEAREVHFAAPEGCTGLQGSTTVQDALERLARTANLFYAGGDGQSSVPGQPLEHPLTVRVVSDCGPVGGVPVEFAASNGGTLAAGGQSGATVTVSTGAEGWAECTWQLSGSGPDAQSVKASLGQPPQPWRRGASNEVRFGAKRLAAHLVPFQPASGCAPLVGTTNVKDALDKLCANLGGGRRGFVVRDVLLRDPERGLRNDAEVSQDDLAKGLTVRFSAPVDPAAFRTAIRVKPVLSVTLDLPYAVPLASGSTGTIGTVPVTLMGTLEVLGDRVVWKPGGDASNLLTQSLFRTVAQGAQSVLGRLTLEGRFIWTSQASRPTYLSGLAFGRPDGTFEMSEDYAGMDFEMWFWVVRRLGVAAGPGKPSRGQGEVLR